MSASTIKCPSGHSNSSAQKFCGQCGVSLVGVCANGHPNAEGQQFCGLCGAPLGQSESASTTRPAPTAAEPPIGAADIGVGATPPRAAPQREDRIAAAVQGAVKRGLSSLKSLWAKLPKWGKVAAIAALPLLVVVALLAGGGRDRESYEFGYGQGRSGMMQPGNRIGSAEEACDSILDYWISLPSRKHIDKGDAMAGCLDGTSGRPLAPGG